VHDFFMALIQETKKGGRYTKKEREERKKKVYTLHFDKGKSAVKISEELNKNRNTINDDIQFWYSELSKELEKSDASSWLMKQIQRLERQRLRLYEDMEKQKNSKDRLAFEKLIFNIENAITQIIVKITFSKNSSFPFKKDLEKIKENDVKKIVRELLSKNPISNMPGTYSKNEIIFHIIEKTKCTNDRALSIFNIMIKFGLKTCYGFGRNIDGTINYNLLDFAIMRGYITEEELSTRNSYHEKSVLKQNQAAEELDQKTKNLDKTFTEKHGVRILWSSEIIKEYNEIVESYRDEFDKICESHYDELEQKFFQENRNLI